MTKKGYSHSETTRKKLSKSTSNLWKNPEYRKHMSEIHKGKPSTMKGKIVSDKIKLKSSKTWFKKGNVPHNKGKPMPEDVKITLSKKIKKQFANGREVPMKGRKQSELAKKRMSESKKGKPSWNKGLFAKDDIRIKKNAEKRRGAKRSEETKKRMSESKKGKPSWNKGKSLSNDHIMKLRKARAGRKYPFYDTIPEKILQKILRENNIGFITQKRFKMPEGRSHKVDVFVEPNICIEADGDYFHKINQKRDKFVNDSLRKQGMQVLRLWEHDLKNNPEKCTKKILKTIKA